MTVQFNFSAAVETRLNTSPFWEMGAQSVMEGPESE